MEKITMDLQMFASPVSPATTNTHVSTNFSKLLEPGLRKIFFFVNFSNHYNSPIYKMIHRSF